MKIFVIGKICAEAGDANRDAEARRLEVAMTRIGHDTMSMGHDLLACSPFPDSVDLAAVTGATGALHALTGPSPSIEIHCPADSKVLADWSVVTGSPPHSGFRMFVSPVSPGEMGAPNWAHTWLLAQLSALEASHAVLALGGNLSGTMNLLLSLAVAKSKPVLPLAFMGGAAAQWLERLRWPLGDVLGERISALYLPEGANLSIRMIQELAAGRARTAGDVQRSRFFIGYSRRRPAEADHIEMVLRRRRLDVYRDEHHFGAGRDLPHEVRAHIELANVFIAVWSKEYACSPWCYDELEYALDRQKEGKTQLWILCVDDTRVISPRARMLVNYPSTNREQMEKNLLVLLERLGGAPSA